MKTQMKISRLMGNKGFTLITSYMFISVLFTFSLALYSYSVTFLDASERNKNKIVAFNFAEAGMSDALVELRQNTLTTTNTDWQAQFSKSDPTQVVAWNRNPNCVSMSVGNIEGCYSVTVTPLPSNVFQISATGFAPGDAVGLRAQESRTVVGFVNSSASLFRYAVFALEGLTLNSNVTTNSYDSTTNPDPISFGSNGDIGTNSIITGSVVVDSNSTVNGDVVIGPGGDPNDVIEINSNASVTGSLSPASSPETFEIKTTSIASGGALSIGGNTEFPLAPGIHRFSSFEVSSNAKLQISGPVEIYVDGPVKFDSNATVNADKINGNLPTDLIIYVTTEDPVTLSSNAKFYGAIYAPKSTVTNDSNVAFHGAIVAKTYEQNSNVELHFDEALNDTGNSSGTAQLQSWRETYTTAGS